MSKNSLSLEITESYTLDSFEITYINVIPCFSATISITITASNRKLYDRVFQLVGQDYFDWTGDDYLYSYIQSNISDIFTI
jgi:hypothetical protein